MSSKLDMVDANQDMESLLLCDDKFSPGTRTLAKFRIINLLFIMALMWLASSMALAQGNNTNRTVVSTPEAQSKDVEGATITASQITLKRGYVASRISANTIKVRKKSGSGTTITTTCLCTTAGQPGGGGSCNVRVDGNRLVCYDGSCDSCNWGKIIVKRR